MPTYSRRTSALLTRQEHADAVAAAKQVLETVGTNWTYTPPKPRRPPLSQRGLRAAALGTWRVGVETDEEEDEEFSEDEEEEGEEVEEVEVGGRSYRRPATPVKKRRRREGVWRAREDDDDDDEDEEERVGERDPYRFEGPGDVGGELEQRRERIRREREEECAWNEGLRLWWRRRDAWTGANSEGECPLGESRFNDNPLTSLISPAVYDQIYNKVILKGAEPPVPINLKHVLNAIVEGWKRDDQWPPKPGKPEPSMRARNPGVGQSTVAGVSGVAVGTNGRKGKEGRGKEAVRRVLGL
ncbi:hypothetical protein RUND412_006952 [Rhizina undulata]